MTKPFLCIPLTFILIIATGYIGSFVVLVPGAQTFESLKDLVVFLSVVLFGYPALITVPFAYGLSDLIEGVPPGFLLGWLPGYFINPAFFWIAYQLIGRKPDFRLVTTWGRYLAFVVTFLMLEPVLWGYMCSDKFTPAISYRSITPALFLTMTITWIIAPIGMLFALPLARRFGWFWAEIPGHVRERAIGGSEWIGEAGRGDTPGVAGPVQEGLPIRIFIFVPFIALVLVMVGATAMVALRSADDDATRLATRLHQEASVSIRMLWTTTWPVRRRRQTPSARTPSSLCCEGRTSARTVELSSSTQPARWSPRPLLTATWWWRVPLPVSHSTRVRRACRQPRRSSVSIT